MVQIKNLAIERMQRWLREQLIDVRRLGLSVLDARDELYERLEAHGLGERLFIVEVFDKLSGVTLVLSAVDYSEEEIITVTP